VQDCRRECRWAPVCAWRSRSRWPRARSPRHRKEMMRRLPSFKSDFGFEKRGLAGVARGRGQRFNLTTGCSVRGRAETEPRWRIKPCVAVWWNGKERRKERKKNLRVWSVASCRPEVPTLRTAVVLGTKSDTSLLSCAPTPLLQDELLFYCPFGRPINSPKCEEFTYCRCARHTARGERSSNSTQRPKND